MNNEIQETRQSDNQQDEGVEQRPPRPLRTVAWIASSVALLGVIVGALFIASGYLSKSSDPIQFITGNLVNVLIFIAIVAQVLIYRKQYQIMARQWEAMRDSLQETRNVVAQNERSIEIAEKTMICAQRAWIIVLGSEAQVTDTGIALLLPIKNAGRTPANNVKVTSVIRIASRLPSTVPRLEKEIDMTWQFGVIGPDSPTSLTTHEIKVERVIADLIRIDQLYLSCEGSIEYQDVFGEPRCTSFHLLRIPGTEILTPWETGNSAT